MIDVGTPSISSSLARVNEFYITIDRPDKNGTAIGKKEDIGNPHRKSGQSTHIVVPNKRPSPALRTNLLEDENAFLVGDDNVRKLIAVDIVDNELRADAGIMINLMC
jgi:hypothetical protein